MSRPLRVMVGAVGWTGHVFPALALGRELGGRGHEVVVETFDRWRTVVEETGARFAAAPERLAFLDSADDRAAPTLAEAARQLAEGLDEAPPDVVVSDLFTLAPALAAELRGIAQATLIPHPYPGHEPGLPFYTLGLLPPRTRLGTAGWRALWPAIGTRLPNTRLRRVRAAIDAARAELGLAPLRDYDGQISDRLALVATFPQLEYPRRWPAGVQVTGPLPFELPYGEVEEPPGAGPLVVVASSTERDPGHELVRVALEALADEPVRVLATLNRRGSTWPSPPPANARVVDWLSYSRVMPRAAAVVCHGGHGTVVRALGAGTPVLVSPPAGDMAETGARLEWSGAGTMLPARLLGAGSLRLAVRRLLEDRRRRARAAEIATWARAHDGAATAAGLVEELAR